MAVIVGLEMYQTRSSGALSRVHYARRDAEGFGEALRGIYGEDRLDLELLVDNDATRGNIEYSLRQAIASLGEDDLFVFYYAGHGFHSAGGNRITAWDSHAHNPEGTTLLLREVLLDPLTESDCRRALAFVDACAADFRPLVRARDVVSDLSGDELAEFLTSASYCALFLSCEPGQKSYPSDELRHGIWTHFLLQALRGEAEGALGPGRFLTDAGLRDYLRREVPAYLTRSTERRQRQWPQAMISASNTFAIREVPERRAPLATAGDLRRISLAPIGEYLEGVESGRIRSLPGFSRSRGHFEPDSINDHATGFVRDLLAERIDEEIQELYDTVKSSFGLRRREISRESGDGQGSLDTEYFRFSIDTRQDQSDPASFVIIRRLVLRGESHEHREEIDDTFGPMFERIVVKVSPDALSYDTLVDLFEDMEEALGGQLRDEEHLKRITYTAPDGTRIRFDVGAGRVSLSGGGRQLVSALLDRAHQYRFGLAGPSQLLLA
ncbi:caspase family protein [Mesorhizobium sp. M0217]|uniref:caspase family protein n=1 Tax=unclassified Mesorhizobium TaxID=325217 RepID=UPI00333A8332